MSLMLEGVRLMVVGMAVVFTFLGLLVAAMQSSALFFKKFAKYFPEKEEPTSGLQRRGESYTDIAVAIAAVKAYTKS